MNISIQTEIMVLAMSGPVKFKYEKKDGSTRTVLGTGCWSYLKEHPEEEYVQPKNRKELATDQYIIIWDLEKKSFRMLLYDSIQSYKRSKYKGKTLFINK